jgi:hypothetical protein
VTALSPAQIDALSNLARKKAGDDVGWVAIAQARELTDLGLAVRTRSGWEITDAGETALQDYDAANPEGAPNEPIPFGPTSQTTP